MNRPRAIILSGAMAILMSGGVGYAQTSTSSAPAGGMAELAGISRPESMVFLLMRRLRTVAPGPASLELRQQIQQWQANVHNRLRKAGDAWVTPKEFTRRREVYQGHLKETQDLFRAARGMAYGVGKPKVDTKAETARAYSKLRQSAASWLDPQIRTFLMAAAEYQGGNATQSQILFNQARTQQPMIAAYAQGESLALIDMNRGGDALAAAMDVLRLRPDMPDAVMLLQKAIQKVPGLETNAPAFAAARDALAKYESPPTPTPTPSTATRTMTWLMPGKAWSSSSETLPIPPADRFNIRQALAVPLMENVLLVDSTLLGDAKDVEVLVRVDTRNLAPAIVKRVMPSGKTPLPPLALLVAPSCTFKPLTLDEFAGPDDTQAVLYGLAIYGEVAAVPREVQTRLQLKANEVQFSGKLLAGDATGPVIAGEKLLGFVTGPTDPTADDGGPQKFIGIGQILPLAKQAKAGATNVGGSYGRLKRAITPLAAPGRIFIAYAISGEKFDDK